MMNERLARIEDPDMCSSGYPIDSKVRVEVKMHTIANTDAWDWYAEANADGVSSNTSANEYLCPRFSGRWESLDAVMTDFEQAHPGEINFFFHENGELVNLLEDHLRNATEPTSPYEDRFAAAGAGMASGCSIYPLSYNSQAGQNSYVITNLYADYLIRNNFHHIWWPQYASETSATVWSWSFNGRPTILLHELGHNIISTGHTNGCQNLMSTDWTSSRLFLSKSQLERLHLTLATTDLHNAVECDNLSAACSVSAVNDVTIAKPMSVFGDLIVQDGVTLTITSQVYFSEHSRIIVRPNAKLIVNGGLLTSGCQATWKGIKVYGGNTDFDVKIENGSTVENTSQAAVSMFAPEPWPQITQWGNGILIAENATFNNVERIAEFMSWTPRLNASRIEACSQQNGKWSITNWNCQTVKILDNQFLSISNDCIVSEGGSFTIMGNTFNSGYNDIMFNNVSAGIKSDILFNIFDGLKVGYNARGTTFAQNLISDNNIHSRFIGVQNDGHNSFDLYFNRIFSRYGAVTFSSGGGIADVHSNIFSGNLGGALADGFNPDYNFFSNCFQTQIADNYIVGTVSPIIHNMGGPANNCFTHQGQISATTGDISGLPNSFNYYEPDDNILDCRDAISSHLNVNRLPFLNSNFPDCQQDGDEGTEIFPPFNDCYLSSENPSELISAISSIQEYMVATDMDESLTEEQKFSLKSTYRTCYKRIRGLLSQVYYFQDDFERMRGLFLEDKTSSDGLVYISSSYLLENNLDSALQFLQSFNPSSESEIDFINIQKINIKRLPKGPFYEPSIEELAVVRNVALKTHALAGYAKALHYILTGETISSDVPELGSPELELRATKIVQSAGAVNIFPSPSSSEFLFIQVETLEFPNVRIFDFLGREIFSDQLNNGLTTIPTSNWSKGIYFIVIAEGERTFSIQKWIYN